MLHEFRVLASRHAIEDDLFHLLNSVSTPENWHSSILQYIDGLGDIEPAK